MRNALATMVLLSALGLGCSQISSKGLSNGGSPTKHDAGGSTTGGPPPGTPCSSDAACGSGVCGLTGTGNCCVTACATADPICAATGCDDGGACMYTAVGTNCGPTSCSDRVQSQPQCDGYGHCSAASLAFCPINVDCNDAGTACLSTCASSADCVKGFFCNAGTCVVAESMGPCTENDDCTSGYCGVDGGGHCCTSRCQSTAPCGATDCDPFSGACVYPGSGVACGQMSCDGGQIAPPPVCDGLGGCQASTAIECAPYACNSGGCVTSCTADAGCAAGYCDAPSSTCCSLPSGGTITVNSVYGSDQTPCCGSPGSSPCQTLGHAMQLIDGAQARDVAIQATSNLAGNWAPPGEAHPVVLGWGAELYAAGITFYDLGAGGRALFEIGAVSANDHVGYASIVEGVFGAGTSSDQSTILVDPGNTLYIADARVSSSAAYQTTAIEVSAGGKLVLGQDQSRAATGLVTIGPAPAIPGDGGSPGGSAGYDGIVCDSANGLGCTVSDAYLGNLLSSVSITMQEYHDIDAEDFAVISLISAPTIGVASSGGPGTCASSDDGALSGSAVLLHGSVKMSFGGGVVQCVSGNGFELEASASGVPILTLTGAAIENTNLGVHASAGTAVITSSRIQYNSSGVEQDTDGVNVGTIDLNSGDAGIMNAVACNRALDGGVIGVSVLNTTTQQLDARNVQWDTPGPDVFMCDATLENCTCEIATCTADAGSNGMDAVYESTGTILTTGNGFASINCSP